MFVRPQVQITRQVLINVVWTPKALLIRHHPCLIMPCTVKKISQSASQSEHITFIFVRYVFSRDFCIKYVFDHQSLSWTRYSQIQKLQMQSTVLMTKSRYIIMKNTGLLRTSTHHTTSGPQNWWDGEKCGENINYILLKQWEWLR